ncbi:MAG: cation:dicarboxylase symporter family transporter, partial [Sinomonas sp.]|nr:cation:dicarboxylase symporter family transporter [Sinomonas sp.]
MATVPLTPAEKPAKKKADRTHWLYIAVIVAVVLGVVVGLVFPGKDGLAANLKPLGDAFVNLIKMMIAPVIFCTIVLGIGSIAKAATVGKVGGLALIYFMVMSTFALGIGLVVGNIIHPGEGLNLKDATYKAPEATDTTNFLLGIIPNTLVSSLTSGQILQTLFVALLVGFALQRMGKTGTMLLEFIRQAQVLVFRILVMIM